MGQDRIRGGNFWCFYKLKVFRINFDVFFSYFSFGLTVWMGRWVKCLVLRTEGSVGKSFESLWRCSAAFICEFRCRGRDRHVVHAEQRRSSNGSNEVEWGRMRSNEGPNEVSSEGTDWVIESNQSSEEENKESEEPCTKGHSQRLCSSALSPTRQSRNIRRPRNFVHSIRP